MKQERHDMGDPSIRWRAIGLFAKKRDVWLNFRGNTALLVAVLAR